MMFFELSKFIQRTFRQVVFINKMVVKFLFNEMVSHVVF